jgi:hypothetical protein
MAIARHLSMRGEVVDIERLRIANGDQVALGNASKNARGDLIGQGGVVLKTQEQIEADWAASKAKRDSASKPVDLKAEQGLAQALANLAPTHKTGILADQDFSPPVSAEPVRQQQAPRRRLVDSDQ